MEYKFKFNQDEYESYLKVVLSLEKEKSILNWKMKILIIVFYIGFNMIIDSLDIQLLLNISMVFGAILIILAFAISSTKVRLKNAKLIAKIVLKKLTKTIYDEKIIEVKNDEVIYTVGGSYYTTKLYDIKEIVIDKNIIALVSYYDKLCAAVPNSVFNDEKEKEEFLQKINEKIDKEPIEEEMDYTYEITVKDYANYLFVNGIKFRNNINKYGLIFMTIILIVNILNSTYRNGIVASATFILANMVIYFTYFYFTRPKRFEKIVEKNMIREGDKYFEKHPEILNTQQVKIEENSIIHCINGLKEKIDFKSVKKVYLKNDTIVVLGAYNQLYFIMPCNVFSSEQERDDFINLLKNFI